MTCTQLHNIISKEYSIKFGEKLTNSSHLYHQGYKCNIMEKVTVRHLTPELECHEH